MIQTNAICRKIAADLNSQPGSFYELSFGDIFAKLLPVLVNLLVNCFDPDDGEQVQKYVSKRYNDHPTAADNAKYGGYKRGLVRATARQAKQAGRKAGERITWQQAREIAIESLDKIRTGDRQQLSLVIRENT